MTIDVPVSTSRYHWFWWLISWWTGCSNNKRANSGNSAAAFNKCRQEQGRTPAGLLPPLQQERSSGGPPPEPQHGGLSCAIIPALGFCWPVRCCCWLALWLSFGLGNFSGTISAFYFINNKRMLIRCYLLLTCKRRVIVFVFCEDGWKCHCQKRRNSGFGSYLHRIQRMNSKNPRAWNPLKNEDTLGDPATFLEFRAWPLRGSCDHTYVTLLLASQRDGRMARRALNSAGLL